MLTYEPRPGQWVDDAIKGALLLASAMNEPVSITFNAVTLTVTPDSTAEELSEFYSDECRRQSEEYERSPEFKKRQEEARLKAAADAEVLRGALALASAEPTFRNTATWEKGLRNNEAGYGRAVYDFASTWARLMEGRIAQGDTVEKCAEEASHIAAANAGITGFQYGCAVSILAHCWIHGEALRRWSNLREQIGTEGERANETGGVLNPALLTIGKE